MDQVPNWLAAVVDAAGMATVYNADDWQRITEGKPLDVEAANDPSMPPQH